MDDREKMTKRIIFAVVAIALLLITVTFSTYAFFNYYRTGAKNNQLITGRIKLLFQDGVNNINLTNQFPIPDYEAVEMTNSGQEIAMTTFTVSGYAGGAIDLLYRVYAIEGEAVAGRNRMSDEHIKLYLTETHDLGTAIIGNGFGTAEDGWYGALASDGRGDTDTADGGEILMIQGQVGTEETTHNYTMRMWISDEVTISDTDEYATYCASEEECLGDRPVFSTMYYSLKLRVENYNPDGE